MRRKIIKGIIIVVIGILLGSATYGGIEVATNYDEYKLKFDNFRHDIFMSSEDSYNACVTILIAIEENIMALGASQEVFESKELTFKEKKDNLKKILEYIDKNNIDIIFNDKFFKTQLTTTQQKRMRTVLYSYHQMYHGQYKRLKLRIALIDGVI